MGSFVALPNAKAGFIRQLSRHKRVRDRERAFILEGMRSIREVLYSHAAAVWAVVLRQSFLQNVEPAFRQMLERSALPVYVCRDMVFDWLSDLANSPGILAVVQQPGWDEEDVFQRTELFGLYGECLQDPTNVGAIIRTAVAFDVDALWLSVGSADIYNPKVVRAAAGALRQLPVFFVREVSEFTQRRCAILASQPPGTTSRPIETITSIPARTVIALGNESRGLSDATLTQASLRFHIPVSPHIDSLNVASSAAIAAFFFRRLAPRASMSDMLLKPGRVRSRSRKE